MTALLLTLAIAGWTCTGLALTGWHLASKGKRWWQERAYEELRRQR